MVDYNSQHSYRLWLFCVYIIMGGLQLPAFLQALIVHLLIALSIYLWVDYNSQEAKQLPHTSVYFILQGGMLGNVVLILHTAVVGWPVPRTVYKWQLAN